MKPSRVNALILLSAPSAATEGALFFFYAIMATITKRELVNMVCAQLDNGCTQVEVLEVIQKTVDSITEALGNGDTVVFRNFGTFYAKEVKPKVGRNPKDPGKDVPIPARTVVKFKVGKNLKEVVAKASK